MKRFLPLLATPLLALATLTCAAQAAPDTALPQVSGEIRKVDVAAGKITIRHEEIPNLEMPPMTMVFRVASPALLEQAKAGEQVLFSADKINGALTVTTLQPK